MWPEQFKTNTEILSQVDNLKYVSMKNFPIIRFIKVFIIYQKLTNILCPEDLYMLSNAIRSVGFIHGVHRVLREAQGCLFSRQLEKQYQMDREETTRKLNAMIKATSDPEFDESYLLNGLTTSELELRNKPYIGGIYCIPDNIIYSQRIVESGTEGEIEWIVIDKVYGCWFAVVTSPHRIKADGKKGCVLFRDINFNKLKQQLRIEISKEKNRQVEYMAIRSKKPNINRVRKVMGVDNDSILNEDDIF